MSRCAGTGVLAQTLKVAAPPVETGPGVARVFYVDLAEGRRETNGAGAPEGRRAVAVGGPDVACAAVLAPQSRVTGVQVLAVLPDVHRCTTETNMRTILGNVNCVQNTNGHYFIN